MNKKKIVFLFLFLLALIPLSIYFFPQWYIKTYINYQVGKANLEEKKLIINEYEVDYFESVRFSGEDKDTMILLHPLGDDKTGFLKLAQQLMFKYHLIIPDFPLFDENITNREVSINDLMNTLHSFLIKKKIENLHILGVGFGAQIAVLFSVQHSNIVNSLLLVGTTGIQSVSSLPNELFTTENISEYLKPYIINSNIMIPFKEYYANFLNDRKKRRNNWIQSLKEKETKIVNISNSINKIEIPTLVIWPTFDKIVNYETAKNTADKIPISQFVTLNASAHYAHRDNPIGLTQRISEFIATPKNNFLKSTRDNHNVKTQIYHWLQLFEDTITPQKEKHHIELLSEFVDIRVPRGFFGGVIPYKNSFLPQIIQNTIARFNVKKFDIKHSVTGEFLVDLLVDKQYFNFKKENIIEEKYSFTLEAQGRPLSRISKILINTVNTKKADSSQLILKKNYITHRAKSLIHQWFFLLERSFKTKEHFEDILLNNIGLELLIPYAEQNDTINSVDELITFLEKNKNSNISHTILSFDVIPSTINPNQFLMKARILWYGVNQNDKLLMSKYDMTFTAIDNPNEPYAKITSITMFALLSPREM